MYAVHPAGRLVDGVVTLPPGNMLPLSGWVVDTMIVVGRSSVHCDKYTSMVSM